MGGKGVPALKWQVNVEHATNRRQRHGSMANSALQAVLREAGGVRANLSLQQAQLLAAGKRFR